MVGKSALVSAIAAASLSFGAAAPASAQAYPTHPIIMVVPLAPGGSTDVLGRIMAQAMGAKLGQPVVVENTAGAAGTIGVTRAERSAPDGYTILWGMWGTNVANGAIYNLGFDLLNDFEPVALVATQPFLIDARKTMPANNLKELVAWLKANADKATMGNSGVGSPHPGSQKQREHHNCEHDDNTVGCCRPTRYTHGGNQGCQPSNDCLQPYR